MKNITVSLDDEVYRRARIEAARQSTSVSALVKKFLTKLVQEESEFDRLERRELMLRERVKGFAVSENLSRDELYGRIE
ncbi:MAG: DUF6364 family protein [Fimbriimonas sp.]